LKQQIALAIALALGSTLASAGDKAGASVDAGATSATAGQTMRWDQVDANKDGYVSKEEAKEAKIATDFASIDVNADGRLSKDEFAALRAGSGAAGPAGPAPDAAASDDKMKKQ